jgi:hypothetical protein
MKYIKQYEHLEEIKNGDIIVCIKNAYDPSDEEYETSPKVKWK